MENNKAVGTDSVHVEMLKTNAGSTAKLLTGMWFAVGRSTVVLKEWLEGITVPLYKRKGSQGGPSNYRPLTILSHLRKLTEKAVILEVDKLVATYKAQFGFFIGVISDISGVKRPSVIIDDRNLLGCFRPSKGLRLSR